MSSEAISKRTAEKSALNTFDSALSAFEAALSAFLAEPFHALPQGLIEQGEAYEEFEALFPAHEQLRRCQEAKDRAREQARPYLEGKEISERAKELLALERTLDAAMPFCAVALPNFLNLGSAIAFIADTSGREVDRAIQEIFRLKPVLKKSGEVRRDGLFELMGRMEKNIDTYAGKPRPYFITALKEESARFHSDREMEERDHLGLTPKESKDLTKDERERRREMVQTAIEVDDRVREAAEAATAEALLIQAEEERERDRIIEAFIATLPEDQARLLELWSQGISPTEALRRLGLKRSTETALRNRLGRLKAKLAGIEAA